MSAAQNFIALAGNPNSGKTTAFNWYTGARQHVGNYPGITVEKKQGMTQVDSKNVLLVDLPGTYSLTAYSLEEVVARRVLTEDKPGAVLSIINAGVLERNLYLAVQMLEMGVPLVLALNMMDEAKAQGISIDVERLEQLTGLAVVPTVARTGKGLKEALAKAVALSESNPARKPLEISYGTDIDEALLKMIPMIEESGMLADLYPARWVALKYMENDEEIIRQGKKASAETSQALSDIVAKTAAHLKATLNTYPEAMIADYRYGYISSILRQGVLKGTDELKDRISSSDKIDQVLTHRFFGPLILAFVLYGMYYLTIEIGDYPLGWVEAGFERLDGFVGDHMREGLLKSLVTAGIIGGIGGVFGFVPLIMIMFLLISVLEDSGYMARVAYMMDRVFRFFGLHGASVMPFIVSGGIMGGCAVPGVMAARTLRSPRERLATILTAPFMACGAKIPVFLLFVSIFFEHNQALILFLLTLAGWTAALLVARLLRSTIIKGEATPFVMELPPYRLPTISGVLIHTWERTWQYIKKAGTIILAIAILIWAAMTFPSLPDEVADGFAAQRAPLEAQLAEYPSHQLAGEIKSLTGQLEETGEGSPAAAALQERIGELTAELETLPAGRLRTEIDALNERLEGLAEGAPETETLKARLGELQEDLDALPEKEIENQLAAIDNEESGATLRHSYAGIIGTAMESVSAPAGFDWRTNIALVGGIAAKEVVISTLGTAYSLGEVDDEDSEATLATRIRADEHWTTANAVALLLFTLLYSPCFVTLAVIKQETGKWRWLFFSLFFNLGLAYTVAVAANQLISRL